MDVASMIDVHKKNQGISSEHNDLLWLVVNMSSSPRCSQFIWIAGQLVALVIPSPRTAGQPVAKSKIQLVNSSPNVVALKFDDL